jgi:hypothetical protein
MMLFMQGSRQAFSMNSDVASRHHQWLTNDVGHPKLQEHLTGVLAIMRGSTSWDQFMRMLQRAYPKVNTTLDLPYPE